RPMSVARKLACNVATVNRWFTELRRLLERHHIKPQHMYNMDETNVRIDCLNGVWLWTWRDLPELHLANPDSRIPATAIEACSATGSTIAPFLILPGRQIPENWVINTLIDDTVLTTSQNGWSDDLIALDWLEHFDRLTKPEDFGEERLLILDNHVSHLTVQFFERATELKIVILPLPPHPTHKLQPLDIGLFNVL
ncbi:hypothetical protein K445DRAFT_53504, partial [Daldinia sp. EC12]